jgi:hypothetical protein
MVPQVYCTQGLSVWDAASVKEAAVQGGLGRFLRLTATMRLIRDTNELSE